MPHDPAEQTMGSSNLRAPGERGNVRGQATRMRILTEAERLFAEHGLSAVPLRDIGQAAGQRNHAAVQYHFGDRDEVIKAIMEYRGAESEVIRTDMLSDLMLVGTPPSITDIVDAFVRPLAVHFRPENHYLAFLSLYITQEGGYEGLGIIQAGATVITLRSLLSKLAPQIPERVLDERWWVTLTSSVHALARYQVSERKRKQLPAAFEVLTTDLIAYLSSGITAPMVEQDPRS